LDLQCQAYLQYWGLQDSFSHPVNTKLLSEICVLGVDDRKFFLGEVSTKVLAFESGVCIAEAHLVSSDTTNVLFRLGEVGLLDGVRLYDFLVFMLVFL